MTPINCLLLGNGVAIVVQTLQGEQFDLEGSDISIVMPMEHPLLVMHVNSVQIPFDIQHIEHMVNTGTFVYFFAGDAGQYTPAFIGEVVLDRDMLLEVKGMIKMIKIRMLD